MGGKHSSSKGLPRTIDYIRTKNVDKLTRQLSKRSASSSRNKKRSQTNVQLLQLDAEKDDQQRSALHFAAIEGDATIIVALYEYMHTVDVTDASGRTPLHYAAIVGNEETLTTLLLCNPAVNRMSRDGTSPLHEAIIHDHPQIFTLLVQHQADANQFFQDYLPPLILAVYLERQQIVELLLRLGVHANLVETRHDRSALHYAAYFHQSTSIFHLLLSSNVYHLVDINARDENGFSVLDYARANVHGNSEFVDLLLQLNVYDPDRGESSAVAIEIVRPNVKIFPAESELSHLKKKAKPNKRILS